jgi:glycosyltransferase involved in cell wall biosynthesis
VRSSFVTWYPYCRRSDAIAEALGGPSHLVHYLAFKRPAVAPIKYTLQSVATLWILRRERPDLMLVAAPPIFAALPVWLAARRLGARFVIDAHTGLFEHARWRWLLPLTRAVLRRADAVVVTNEHLRRIVASWGARAVVIGDVPVRFGPGVAPASDPRPRVVVVNTFSVDEPLGEVLEAARAMPEAAFLVTGDVRYARGRWLRDRPANLVFTGFVSEEEYAGLLRAADVVVVLTLHDHTMQRGGYEAMALGKPLVTSDWGVLRETFSRGTVHVENTATAIAAGIRRTLAERERLACEMESLRREREALFRVRLAELLTTVGTPDAARAAVASAVPRE